MGLYFVAFYPIKSIARNKVWKNDFALFTNDVNTSYNSAKSNCSAGGKLWEEGKQTLNKQRKAEYFTKSEKYLRKSLKIHPTYNDAWLLLGNVLFDANKDIEQSANCYIEVLKRQTQNKNAWQNVDIVLQQSDNRNLQLEKYSILYKLDSSRFKVNYRLGVINGRYLNNLPKGIYYLKRAVDIEPNNIEAIKDLGTAYGFSGLTQEAYQVSKKAIELDKNDPQIYINLGIAAARLGLKEEADQCFARAEELKEKP